MPTNKGTTVALRHNTVPESGRREGTRRLWDGLSTMAILARA